MLSEDVVPLGGGWALSPDHVARLQALAARWGMPPSEVLGLAVAEFLETAEPPEPGTPAYVAARVQTITASGPLTPPSPTATHVLGSAPDRATPINDAWKHQIGILLDEDMPDSEIRASNGKTVARLVNLGGAAAEPPAREG